MVTGIFGVRDIR